MERLLLNRLLNWVRSDKKTPQQRRSNGFGRYQPAFWRHVGQTILTLQHLQWRAPVGRHRRPLDHWQVHRRYGTSVGLRA
jgi:hypothetical protein